MHITTALTLGAALAALGGIAPPAGAQSPSETPGALTLETFTAEVLERSPSLHAATSRIGAAQATAIAAGALPDPRLLLGVTNLPVASPGVADMMTMKQVGLSQTLPYPGKLGLAETAARHATAALEAAHAGARWELIRAANRSWFTLGTIDSRLTLLARRRDAVRAMARAVEAQYEAGQASQAAVWRSRTELARLVEEAATLAEERRGVVATLNALRLRPAGTSIDGAPMPVRLLRAALTDAASLRFAGDSLGAALVDDAIPSASTLFDWAADSNPMIRVHTARIASQDARVALAERASRPDVDLMLMYGQRNDRSDFISASIAIPLAIRSSRVQRRRAEAEALELEAEHDEHRQMVADIAARLVALRATAVAARTRLAVLDHHVLLLGRAALASALAGHRAGDVQFADVLESLTSLFADEERHIEALATFATSIAAIEAIVGREILP